MASQAPPAVRTDDVSDWVGRVKEVVSKPAILTDPRPAAATPWKTDFFGCFDPIDTCLLSYTLRRITTINIS
jgi:hypothetical protein